jgi:hypothetical protein
LVYLRTARFSFFAASERTMRATAQPPSSLIRHGRRIGLHQDLQQSAGMLLVFGGSVIDKLHQISVKLVSCAKAAHIQRV